MRADRLDDECTVFVKYLTGAEPAPDVLAAYRRAHEVSAVVADHATLRSLESALLQVARIGPAYARLADSYAGAFARASVLRRKLVLLVAILESRGATAAALDTATPGSRAMWILETSARVAVSAVLVLLATLIILPVRLLRRPVDARGV